MVEINRSRSDQAETVPVAMNLAESFCLSCGGVICSHGSAEPSEQKIERDSARFMATYPVVFRGNLHTRLQRTQAAVFLIVVLFDSLYPSSQNGLMAYMHIRAGLPANTSRRRDAGCNQLLVSCRSKWPGLVLLQIIQQALAQKSGHLPQW